MRVTCYGVTFTVPTEAETQALVRAFETIQTLRAA